MLPTRLTMIRQSMGLSRTELAQQAQITIATVYNIEGGLVSNIHLSTLMKLANALRVTPDYLLGINQVKAA